MECIGGEVSYVRSPFVGNSYYCLMLAVLSLALAGTSTYLSVSQAGQGGLNTGALSFASIMAVLVGLWYGLLSFREKERNYILTEIGISIGLVPLIIWVVIIITGFIRQIGVSADGLQSIITGRK